MLLSRIPQFVKPFYPQLQRTFVKSLSDPTSLTVRTRAIAALGILMTQQPRIDPLVTELVTGARNAEESDLKESMILGLAAVCGSGGKNVGEAAMKNVLEFLEDSLAEGGKESILVALAKLVGGLAKQRAPVLQPILGWVCSSPRRVQLIEYPPCAATTSSPTRRVRSPRCVCGS